MKIQGRGFMFNKVGIHNEMKGEKTEKKVTRGII